MGDERVEGGGVLPCSIFRKQALGAARQTSGAGEVGAGENTGESGESVCYVNQLPSEVLLHVFSFLSVVEVCRSVAPVCRTWRDLATDPTLWTRLVFIHYPVTEQRLQQLVSEAPHLMHLALQSHQHGKDVLLQVAASCPRLRHITLKFCEGVTEEALAAVAQGCPDLHYLNLEGSQMISGQCYHQLANLTHLTHLNLSHCHYLDDAGLLAIASDCHHLQHLNIDGITGVHDCSVVGLAQLLACSLRHLQLDGENLTDTAYLALGACKQLECLGVSFCDKMTDLGLRGLHSLTRLTWLKLRKGIQLRPPGLCQMFQSGSLAHLTYLNLGECTLLDDAVLAAVAYHCPALLHLELNWCWDVTDAGLALLVAGCPLLRFLILVGVVQLTGSILPALTEALPNLRVLDLEQCNTVDDSSLLALVVQRPSLKIFDYWGDTVVAPQPED